ncbi:M48 family metallopeptidase [Lachnospiraceae bacterium LCP25S3_G4]
MYQKRTISGIEITVEKKNIKNMYLRILPPDGMAKVTAPMRISDDVIQNFVESRLEWIQKQQKKVTNFPTKMEKKYISGEVHYLWGKRYHLEVVSHMKGSSVFIEDNKIILQVPIDFTVKQRQRAMKEWYRQQLKEALPAVVEHCQKVVGTTINEWRIKDMRTRWGTCNIDQRRIWINLQLVTKPPECLEYVIIHEVVHLYEKNHNSVFYSYMDKFFPKWRLVKKQLNTRRSE